MYQITSEVKNYKVKNCAGHSIDDVLYRYTSVTILIDFACIHIISTEMKCEYYLIQAKHIIRFFYRTHIPFHYCTHVF